MKGISAYLIVATIAAGCAIKPSQQDLTGEMTVSIVKSLRCEVKDRLIERAVIEMQKSDDAATQMVAADLQSRISSPGLPDRQRNRILENLELDRLDEDTEKHIRSYFKHDVTYAFEFTITEKGENGGGFTLGIPITNGDLTIGLSANKTLERKSQNAFNVTDQFIGYLNVDCDAFRLDKDTPFARPISPNMLYPIAGKVGLAKVVDTYIDLTDDNGRVKGFSDEITFTTTITGSVTPTLMLDAPINDLKVTKANWTTNGTRTDVHKVTVSMAPGSVPPTENTIQLTNEVQLVIKSDNLKPVATKKRTTGATSRTDRSISRSVNVIRSTESSRTLGDLKNELTSNPSPGFTESERIIRRQQAIDFLDRELESR